MYDFFCQFLLSEPEVIESKQLFKDKFKENMH